MYTYIKSKSQFRVYIRFIFIVDINKSHSFRITLHVTNYAIHMCVYNHLDLNSLLKLQATLLTNFFLNRLPSNLISYANLTLQITGRLYTNNTLL